MSGVMFPWLPRKTFAHGVHPPESKDDTKSLPIRQLPFADLLIVPLSQHIGKPAVAVVSEGEEVERGQCIAKPDGFLSVAIHAPAAGVIRRIARSPSINGGMEPAFFLEPFPASTQEAVQAQSRVTQSDQPREILAAIQQAGIVGLGGAGFPTHAKLTIPEGKSVDTIVVNGAECEPYLTTDHRVMLEQPDDVCRGVRLVLRATGAQRAIIAVEANKSDAADVLRESIPEDLPISVQILPVKYPQGAEKMLITSVLQRRIPPQGLPVDVHALCINVGTTAEIGKLLPSGKGLFERVITVTGAAVEKKGNYLTPIGTTLRYLMDVVGTSEDFSTVVMGGPMMGMAASHLDVPITKGSTGVIALTDRDTSSMSGRREFPCIHCGRCVDACPLFLNPAQLGRLADRGRVQEMVGQHHLKDCFECGCCTFVCPSNLPLVQKFRVAKAAARKTGAIR